MRLSWVLLLLLPGVVFSQFVYHQAVEDILVYKENDLKTIVDTIYTDGVFTEIMANVKEKSLYILYLDSKTGHVKQSIRYKKIEKKDYKWKQESYRRILQEQQKAKDEIRKSQIIDSIDILYNLINAKLPKNKAFVFLSSVQETGIGYGVSISFYSSFPKDLKYIEFFYQGAFL